MEINDTAYNEYVLCADCEHGQENFVAAEQSFKCPQWSVEVKNVGICKFYKRCENGNSEN